jgi:hypothetical protein
MGQSWLNEGFTTLQRFRDVEFKQMNDVAAMELTD